VNINFKESVKLVLVRGNDIMHEFPKMQRTTAHAVLTSYNHKLKLSKQTALGAANTLPGIRQEV